MNQAKPFVVLALAVLGCSSGRPGPAGPSGSAPVDVADDNACDHICNASVACGDVRSTCATKCTDWLVTRARPGIAGATARCAVPRIDSVCDGAHTTKSAANALVGCIDEAGRLALRKDRDSLLMVAHAMCDRSARCGESDETEGDGGACIERFSTMAVPRGLGIFGAMKPELVKRFAACMNASSCDGSDGATACFAQMLGDRRAPEPAPTAPEGGEKI